MAGSLPRSDAEGWRENGTRVRKTNVRLETYAERCSELVELLWRDDFHGIGQELPVKVLPSKSALVARVHLFTRCRVSMRRAEHVAAFAVESQQANLLVAGKAPAAILLDGRSLWLVLLLVVHGDRDCDLGNAKSVLGVVSSRRGLRCGGDWSDWSDWSDWGGRLDGRLGHDGRRWGGLGGGLGGRRRGCRLCGSHFLLVALATEVVGGRIAEEAASCSAERRRGGLVVLHDLVLLTDDGATTWRE